MFAALKKLAIAAFATALLAVPTSAADWAPDGPITVKVGFGPGGAADALARAVGEAMEKNTGWKVVVENVEGGGGLTMLTGLQAAAPDGKTLGFGVTVPVWINLQKRGDQLPFKLDSFDWLGTVGRASLSLVIKSDLEAKDFAGLVEMSKKDGILVATNGPAQEMIVQAMAKATGGDFISVPTKSASETIQNLLGGHVQAATLGGAHADYVKKGDMVVVVSLAPVRDEVAPDVPTLIEDGYPFAVDAAFYFNAPAGLDPAAKAALASALDEALKAPAAATVISKMGMTAENLGPEGTTKMMDDGLKSVGEMLAAIGGK